MKGMRAKFTNKRGKPRQRPMGRIVKLAAGSTGFTTNNAWRFR